MADELYQKIKSKFREYFVVVPLWGLEIPPDFELSVYSGHMFRAPEASVNPTFSTLCGLESELSPQGNNLYGIVFYEFRTIGDEDYLRELAIERAAIVIYILRLYLSSAIDKHVMTIPPELRFTHISSVQLEKVYLQAVGAEGLPTITGQPRHYLPHRIGSSKGLLHSLHDRGFVALNSRLESLMEEPTEMSERLKHAIVWFGRSIESDRLADSFLFCAISAETLLSTGRTPQEAYAHNMARLVLHATGNEAILRKLRTPLVEHIYHVNPQEIMRYLEQRVLELFEIRNHIAHGHIREFTIIRDLIEFEDIVRATIFAIATGPWATLDELRYWVQSNRV